MSSGPFRRLLSSIRSVSVAVVGSLFLAQAMAQGTPASVFRELAELKAECQQLAKLLAERTAGGDEERIARRLGRAAAEVRRVLTHTGEWTKLSQKPDAVDKLAVDVKALLAMLEARSAAALPEVVAAADRCTTDAETIMGAIQGAGAGGRAMLLASKALYLSQRAARDYVLIHARNKPPGITGEVMDREREEMSGLLQQLDRLPSNAAYRQSLDAAKAQWQIMLPALTRREHSRDKEELVLRSSEIMFDALDEVLDQLQKTVLLLQ